jgi:hypothetical protein
MINDNQNPQLDENKTSTDTGSLNPETVNVTTDVTSTPGTDSTTTTNIETPATPMMDSAPGVASNTPSSVTTSTTIGSNAEQKPPTPILTTPMMSGSSTPDQPRKKTNLKLVVGVVVLFLVLLGSGVGFYLSQQTQDIRQQAVEPVSVEAGECAFPTCDAECSLTSCNVSCEPNTPCTTGKNTFYCEGERSDGCNELTAFASDNTGAIDSTNPDYWCTTYQIDAWARNNTNNNIEESASEVGFIGRNGKVCKWDDSACVASDPEFWNCASETPPPETPPPPSGTPVPSTFSCNSYCTSNNQCTGVDPNYSCVTISLGGWTSWLNSTGAVSVGSGAITGFATANFNNTELKQYAVRGGQLWVRTYTERTGYSSWNDSTGAISGTGITNLVSFSGYVQANGNTKQYAVGDNKLFTREQINGTWTAWNDTTGATTGTGTGTLTGFDNYVQANGNEKQAAVRNGVLYIRERINGTWTSWAVNNAASTAGEGTLYSFSAFINLDGIIRQYAIRGPGLYARDNADKRCRLTTNTTSTTCSPATTPTPTPTPTPAPLTCNSECTLGLGEDPCTAVNSLWSCYSGDGTATDLKGNCRLTSYPTSTTCTAPDELMCKDVAILDQNNNEIDPKTVPSPFSVDQIIKLRCSADRPSIEINHYEFRITQPNGTIIDGSALNPGGTTAISLPYTIPMSGTFKAQCRLCLTVGGCQPYVDIQTAPSTSNDETVN